MTRTRSTWWIGGSLLTAAVLVWCLVQTVGVLARSTESVELTRSAAGVERLVVDLAGGSVEIRGTDRDELRVEGEVVSGLTTTPHREEVEGERFLVTSACAGGPLSTFCEVHHLIEVPSDLDVVVRSSDTDVTLVDLEGTLDVATSDGAVRGERLSGDELLVDTSDADVDLRAVRSPVVRARTSDADLAIAFDEPVDDLETITSNASIRIVLPDTSDPYTVDLETSNGEESVSVRTDPTAPRRVLARSSNGDIDVSYPPGRR